MQIGALSRVFKSSRDGISSYYVPTALFVKQANPSTYILSLTGLVELSVKIQIFS